MINYIFIKSEYFDLHDISYRVEEIIQKEARQEVYSLESETVGLLEKLFDPILQGFGAD